MQNFINQDANKTFPDKKICYKYKNDFFSHNMIYNFVFRISVLLYYYKNKLKFTNKQCEGEHFYCLKKYKDKYRKMYFYKHDIFSYIYFYYQNPA